MEKVGIFHHIGDEGEFTNTIEEILAFDEIVTFDGAYLSVWEYRTQLEEKEPILFVQGDTVGTNGVMSWDDIDHLAAAHNFIIGWHGWSHRKLTELPDHAVIKELTNPMNSKLYAYPHGDWDERVAKIVKDMGYLRAYSTTQGVQNNDFAIPRIYI